MEIEHPHRRWLIVILLLGCTVRLLWGQFQPSTIDAITLPDQAEYLQLGAHLLHEGRLYFHDERFSQDIHAYRTPGYPAFVAMMGAKVRVIRAGQAVLDTSTALAIFLLARRLGSSGSTSLIGAGFVAFNPFLIYFSALVLSETLFTCLLAWSLVLLTSRLVIGAALLMAGAVLVRPSAMWLGPVLAGLSIFLNSGKSVSYYWNGLVVRALLFVVVMSLALLPWAYRNHRILGSWISGTTNDGITFYDGFRPGATGASDQSFLKDDEAYLREKTSELSRSRMFGKLATEAILKDPLRAIRLGFIKIARTWSPVPLSQEYRGLKYWLVGLLYTVPFDVLVIVGFARSKALTAPAKLLLLTPALYFTLIHAASVGSLRYRIPVEPPMAVIAAAGIRIKNEGRSQR